MWTGSTLCCSCMWLFTNRTWWVIGRYGRGMSSINSCSFFFFFPRLLHMLERSSNSGRVAKVYQIARGECPENLLLVLEATCCSRLRRRSQQHGTCSTPPCEHNRTYLQKRPTRIYVVVMMIYLQEMKSNVIAQLQVKDCSET